MAERIEFNWDEPFVDRDKLNGDKPIETFPEDKLDRVKYANFLTQFLAGQGYDKAKGEKRNYVLNLNSEWGSGKTYFLRRWAEDLKEHYPVVYVDAWKQDYSDDPLMTVISSMINQLREQAGKTEDDPVFKAPRKLMGLLKAAAPSVVGGMTKRFLGIDPVAIMRAAEDEEVEGEVLDDSGEPLTDENGKPIDMGAAASKMVQHLIHEHDAKAETIESLKLSVEQWVEAVIGREQEKGAGEPKRTYPAFVFIDELDRCRPSYAVEMLETIKHIFNIPGVVFVVATDTEQLQHAVKAVYGEGFNARVYLGRFFNSRFSLKAPSFKKLLDVHCRTELLDKKYLEESGIDVWNLNEDVGDTLNNITSVLNLFKLPARSAIQVVERLIATISNEQITPRIDMISLLIFYCVRESNEQVFNELVKGDINYQGKNERDNIVNSYFNEVLTDSSKSGFDTKLRFEVSPSTMCEMLRDGRNNQHVNKFPDLSYSCTVSSYYNIITRTIFYRTIATLRGNLQYNTEAFCSYQKKEIEKTLISIQGKEKGVLPTAGQELDDRLEHLGIKWIEYKYLYDSIGINAKIDVYKDLVELASALDWIDGEVEE